MATNPSDTFEVFQETFDVPKLTKDAFPQRNLLEEMFVPTDTMRERIEYLYGRLLGFDEAYFKAVAWMKWYYPNLYPEPTWLQSRWNCFTNWIKHLKGYRLVIIHADDMDCYC